MRCPSPSLLRIARARRLNGLLGVLPLLLLVPVAANAQDYLARYRRVEEPQLLKMRIYDVEAGLNVEDTHQKSSFRNSDARSTYDRTYIAPSISTSLGGSIYHPNFLRYTLSGEASYGSGEQETSSGETFSRDEVQDLQRLRGDLALLSGKPLSATAYGHYGRSYRDYDFFTRSTVNSLGYGAQTSYRAPALYTTVYYSHLDEETEDSLTPSSTDQDTAGFTAQNTRRHGSSQLNYTFNEIHFEGSDPSSAVRANDHSVSVSDSENLGDRRQVHLQSSASYSKRESDTDENDQTSANANLFVEHRPNLDSSLDATYDRFSTEGFTSENAAAHAELRHQLYESLHSTLIGEGSEVRTSGEGSGDPTRRFGAGLTENYTKRLTPQHRLRVDNTLFVDNVEQSGIGRAVNERHTFPRPPDIESFLLDLSNIDEDTIEVTDANDIRRFVRGIDYDVFPRGSRTEIRRIPGGEIPEGGTVLVSYSAAPGGSDSYQTFSESFGVRLELWENLWDVYGRFSGTFDNAAPDVNVQDARIYTAGTEIRWHPLNAGAEYEIYESSDADYRSLRFYESAGFRPDALSSLSLRMSQSFTEQRDADRRERDYRFTTRYRRSLTRRLWTALDAGVDLRRGPGVDQDLAVVRPELNYRIGLTTLEVYYDYEYNLYLNNEERHKQKFVANLKRKF